MCVCVFKEKYCLKTYLSQSGCPYDRWITKKLVQSYEGIYSEFLQLHALIYHPQQSGWANNPFHEQITCLSFRAYA